MISSVFVKKLLNRLFNGYERIFKTMIQVVLVILAFAAVCGVFVFTFTIEKFIMKISEKYLDWFTDQLLTSYHKPMFTKWYRRIKGGNKVQYSSSDNLWSSGCPSVIIEIPDQERLI